MLRDGSGRNGRRRRRSAGRRIPLFYHKPHSVLAAYRLSNFWELAHHVRLNRPISLASAAGHRAEPATIVLRAVSHRAAEHVAVLQCSAPAIATNTVRHVCRSSVPTFLYINVPTAVPPHTTSSYNRYGTTLYPGEWGAHQLIDGQFN